jgi:DNA-binding NtrC family response regulator
LADDGASETSVPRVVAPVPESGACELVVVASPDPAAVSRRVAIERPTDLGRKSRGSAPPPSALSIDDRRLSRSHATVAPRHDGLGLELQDLDSRNGCFVDGTRVKSARLAPGAVVRAGDTVFVVDRAPPGEPIATPAAAVGASPAFLAACRELAVAAGAELPVLLLGETGTGKEVFARHLHEVWRGRARRTGQLVVLDCATIPRDLVEASLFGHQRGAFTGATADAAGHLAAASGGTLFLDEIGELPFHLQGKLLRAVETGEFTRVGSVARERADLRIVAATSADLPREVQAGTFRADLYARLAGYVVRLPPLRERRRDIPLLLSRFRPLEVSADAMERLLLHGWPMNVRELRAVAHRLALRAVDGKIELADVERALGVAAGPPRTAPALTGAEPSRDELAGALRRCGGSVAEVAAEYGKDRKQIYRWLERHALDPRDFKA